MALTLDPDKSYVVYESWKKKRNFYCIERTGYTKVNELVNDFLYHAVDVHNAMTLCNITFVETYRVDSAAYTANPEYFTHNYMLALSERKREVSVRGYGYEIGDVLEFTDPSAVVNNVQEGRETVKIEVTDIHPASGGITDFKILHPGSYRTPTNGIKYLKFRTKTNSFATDLINLDVSYITDKRGVLATGFTNDTDGNIFIFQSRHEGNGNVWVPTTAPGTLGDPLFGYWQYGPTVHKSYKGAVARLSTVHIANLPAGAVLPQSGLPASTPGAGVPTASSEWTWYHTDAGTGKTVLQTTYNSNYRQTKSFAKNDDVDSVLGIDPWTQTFGQSYSLSLPGTSKTPHIAQPFGSGDTTGGRGGDGDLASLSNVQFALGETFSYGLAYEPGSQTFFGNLTRWPTDGIWTNVDISTNTVLYPGQEILLVAPQSNSESYIPPGTVITDMASIEVVNGVREIKNVKAQSIVIGGGGAQYVQSQGTITFFENTARYIWFRTNNPIKIDKGDRFVVRGNGAAFSDTQTLVPEKFTLVTEVAASADALADDQGFLADVRFIDLTGANLMIDTMTTTHTRISPYPYLGQVMEIVTPSAAAISASYTVVGGLNAVISNIANVNVDNGTANITLAVPQGIPLIDCQVKFSFPVLQPWRMAFKAENSQQLNVFAGTKIQLQDTGEVARITDYSGSVNDLAGLVGSIPTIKKFDTTATVTATIGFGWANTAGTLDEVDFGGTPYTFTNFKQQTGLDANNVIQVTTIAGGSILPGMEFDINSGTPVNSVASNKILYQLKPLASTEVNGGLGRYLVEYNNQKFNSATTITDIKIGRIADVEVDELDISQGFVNRKLRVADHPEAYPLSFMATFTTRGIFFGVWEGSWTVMQKSKNRQISERDAWFNWVLCQRPVDRNTGHTRTNGQSPVFCVNSVGYKYWKFIVRERDTVHPTQGDRETKHYVYNKQYLPNGGVFERYTPFRVPADKHTEDSHALLNTTEQIALTEDSKYLVSFLYNLTTPRFRYSDELDMIGQTAADVAMASNNLKLTTYGEPNERTYRSLGANLPYNMGLRIVVLTDLYQN